MADEPESTPVPASATPRTATEKSSEDTFKPHPQVPFFPSFPGFNGGHMQMFPVMYPAVVPGINSLNQDESNRGAGLYAVPVGPYMRPTAGLHSNTLIPLTYNVPTRQSSEAGATGQGQGQGGPQQQNLQQQPPHQRQVVVRRFQIAIQLDLLLILKLAAVIFLFNQDGSRQRLVVLIFFASLVYLYQTGALAPLMRWLSQGMQRAAAPPQAPRAPAAAAAAENVPLAAGEQGNENPNLPAEGQAGAENENRAAVDDGNQAAGNVNAPEPAAGNGANHWWGIVKEIQMIVFGFISSLLPGFHNID